MGSAIFNTIRIPLIALVLVVLFATFISYLAVRKRNLFTNLIDSLSMVPYIVPGTVPGIAFISSFNTGLFWKWISYDYRDSFHLNYVPICQKITVYYSAHLLLACNK